MGVLGEIVGLLREIVDHIPTPDPELRRARILRRLSSRIVRLEDRLRKNPDDFEAKAALAGIKVQLEALTSAGQE